MASTGQTGLERRYRPTKQITDEMRMHCHIYLDEHLYSSAITLLTDIVTAGASHPDFPAKPIAAPLPFHIELVSALLIHPSYTTRATDPQTLELASKSIGFLRNVLEILGPLNANLKEAFSFVATHRVRPTRRSRSTVYIDDGTSGSDSDERPERTKGIIANQGRIRTRAQDFWHMVGWALNCSVKCHERWKYWKVWLAYMLDVLDADWYERKKHGEFGENGLGMLSESILATYLADARGRPAAARRVVKSLFADGGTESLKNFPEVFPNEFKTPKTPAGQKRKRDDPKNCELRYDDSDDTEDGIDTLVTLDEMDDTLEAIEVEMPLVDSWLGGTESLSLRQRVLALLSRIAFELPESFIRCGALYEIVYDCVKPLPIPAFSTLLSTSKSSQLPEVVSVSLGQVLLARLLPASAPRPSDISGGYDDDLSQEILEKCFLPFSAVTSSVADNAKVSVLIEGLLRLFMRHYDCDDTPSLKAATEQGILARAKKVNDKRRRKYSEDQDTQQDEVWLRASSERLRSLVSWLEHIGENID